MTDEQAEPAGWSYEFHEFGDVWKRHVILNRPDCGANPPTKHHGSPVRNVRPLYAIPVHEQAEPVAWRYRHVPTVAWAYSESKHPRENLEQQPLYAAPVPEQASAPDAVATFVKKYQFAPDRPLSLPTTGKTISVLWDDFCDLAASPRSAS